MKIKSLWSPSEEKKTVPNEFTFFLVGESLLKFHGAYNKFQIKVLYTEAQIWILYINW